MRRWPRLLAVGARLAGIAGLAALLAGGRAGAAQVGSTDLGGLNTTVFTYLGEVLPGDYDKLKKAVEAAPAGNKKILILRSPGGSISEGILLGRYIYKTGIATFVPKEGGGCHSACTFMFLAGHDNATDRPRRVMMVGALIGFHQARVAVLSESLAQAEAEALETVVQSAIGDITNYFRDIKADPEFLSMALSSPSSGLRYLSEFEALRLGVFVMDPVTGKLVSPEEFGKLNATKTP